MAGDTTLFTAMAAHMGIIIEGQDMPDVGATGEPLGRPRRNPGAETPIKTVIKPKSVEQFF